MLLSNLETLHLRSLTPKWSEKLHFLQDLEDSFEIPVPS